MGAEDNSDSESSDTTAEFNDLQESVDNDTVALRDWVPTYRLEKLDKPSGANEYPAVWKLQRDTANNGETHVVIDGHEKELELRRGQSTFDYNDALIRIKRRNDSDYNITFDSIQSWYVPQNIWH